MTMRMKILLAAIAATNTMAQAQSGQMVLLEQPDRTMLTVEGALDSHPRVLGSAYQYKPGQHWIARTDGRWSAASDPSYCLASQGGDRLTVALCGDEQVLRRMSAASKSVRSSWGVQPTPFAETAKPAIDPTNRAAVLAFYNNQYVIQNFPLSGWTGNIAACVPGDVSPAFRALTAQRVNYFRDMAGVPLLTVDAAANIPAMAGALISSATSVSGFQYPDGHNPPANATCFTAIGLEGTSTSNIWTSTRGGPDNIDGMIADAIVISAPSVGHRTLVLQPSLTAFGSGDVPFPSVIAGRTTISLFKGVGNRADAVSRDAYVAWPPRGFVPYPVLPDRWSINILNPQADVTNATVTMRRADGTAVDLTRTNVTNNARFSPQIVWTVNDDAFTGNPVRGVPPPKTDVSVDVTIGNVMVNGQAQTITYGVTVIDANSPANDINLTRIRPGDVAAGATVATLSAYKFPRSFAQIQYALTLVEGAGSTDNALFAIQGANLTAAAPLAFSTRGRYSIRVRVDDGRENGIFEKAIIVQPSPGRPGDVSAAIRLADGQAATAAPSSNAAYTISVTNNAAFPVSNVVVADTLPAGFALSAADTNNWQAHRLYRYARLVVDAPAQPNDINPSQLQIAEIGMLDANGNQIDKKAWNLFFPNGQRNFDSALAIDNDPNTFWQAGGAIGAATTFPYEIQIDLARPSALTGFTVLGGPQNAGGWPGVYRFFLSNDRTNWGNPIAQGTFGTDESVKTVNFAPPNVAGQIAFTFPGPIAPAATVAQNIVLTASATAGTYTNTAVVLSALDDNGDPLVNTNANAGSATSPALEVTATPGTGPGPAPAPARAFQQIDGVLIQISAGSDGTLMGSNANQEIYIRNGNAWRRLDNGAAPLTAVASADRVFAAIAGRLFMCNTVWQEIPMPGADITFTWISAASDGTLMAVATGGNIHRRDAQTGDWRLLGGGPALRVAVRNATEYYVLRQGGVIQRSVDGGPLTTIPNGLLLDISVSSTGEVWGIGIDQGVYRYNGTGFDRMSRADQPMVQAVIGNATSIWAINAAGLIFQFR